MAERLYEDEVVRFFTVHEDTVDSGGTKVSQYRVLTGISVSLVEILEVVARLSQRRQH